MNHDMQYKHQGKNYKTEIVLNKRPEFKYLVQSGFNDYLFFDMIIFLSNNLKNQKHLFVVK